MQANEINKLISICHSNLKNSKKCLKYLIKDRFLDKESILKYKIGFFPQNISMLKEHVSEDVLTKTSILDYYNNSSDFSNYFYLIFPIFSEFNDAIGISGRSLMPDEERAALGIPKYKNSSYKKANILYGLNFSKNMILKSNNVYILEGYFDHLSLSKSGVYNSVAICGTAFSQKHFLKLARYSDKMTFILDADSAGQKTAERIFNKYSNKGIKLRFLRVPEPYKDIDEYFSDPINSKATFFKDFKQFIPNTW